jgi:hypothetical protein
MTYYLANVSIDEDVTAIEISMNNAWLMGMQIPQSLKHML